MKNHEKDKKDIAIETNRWERLHCMPDFKKINGNASFNIKTERDDEDKPIPPTVIRIVNKP